MSDQHHRDDSVSVANNDAVSASRMGARGLETALFGGLAGVALMIYCATGWQRLTNDWTTIWEQSVLIGTFLVRDGKPLYYGLTQHPALTTMYGPFTYYLLLPATATRRPDWAVVIAGLWAGMIYALPVPVLLLMARRMKRVPLRDCALVILAFTGLTLYYPSNSFCGVIPATLSVGVGALAVLAAAATARHRTLPLELCTIALAALALLTKQVMVPLVAVYPLLVWQVRGFSAAVGAALRMAGGILLMAGLVCLLNNPRNMYLHTIWIPAHQGWNSVECLSSGVCPATSAALTVSQKARTFVWLGMKLLIDYDYAVLWVGLAGALLWKRLNRTTVTHTWPFILSAVLLVPTSLMNVAKLGGTPTNYLICTYFIFLSAAAFVLDLDPGSDDSARKVASALVILPLLVSFGRFARDPRIHRLSANNPDRVAYETTRSTNDTFFPWYPLSTYLATGHVYDYPQAIIDRDVAGVRPSDRYIEAGLPSNTHQYAFAARDEILLDPLVATCAPMKASGALATWIVKDCSNRSSSDPGAEAPTER